MADFVSGFWNWYIFILVVLSIVFLVGLVYWMSEGKRKPGEQAKTMGHVWDEDLAELNNPLPGWWLKLYYGTVVFAIGYLVLYPGVFKGVLGWTEVGEYQAEVKAASEKFDPIFNKYASLDLVALGSQPEALKMGERLYMTYCTACHGSDAGGNPGFPNLRDHDWLWGGDPAQIEATIMNGRSAMMPAWQAALGNEGVYNTAQYVMSLSGRKVNEDAAAAGKEKFQQLCVGCHGPEGKGNPMMGAPNLTDKVWLYGSSESTIMKTIANGRQGRMPAHGEFLGQAKVHLLAGYIHSLSQQKTQ